MKVIFYLTLFVDKCRVCSFSYVVARDIESNEMEFYLLPLN
jgi:hypothetical protein